MVSTLINLVLLIIVAFLQNMAFTWSSRSRNSGDPKYHFFVALLSNGVWFVCNFVLILPEVLKVIENGNYWMLALVGFLYVLATSAGSSVMMKILLKKETGKRKVGASK